MSFILDALRRSERARRVLGAMQPGSADRDAPVPRATWMVGVVALLVVNAMLLAWFVLRTDDALELTTPAPVTASAVRSLAREAGDATSERVAPPTELIAPGVAPSTLSASSALALAELAPDRRTRAAAFHIDVHGWADEPAQRFVVINLRRRVVGDSLDSGARLVEIVADGAVIEIEGQRVLLPRQ